MAGIDFETESRIGETITQKPSGGAGKTAVGLLLAGVAVATLGYAYFGSDDAPSNRRGTDETFKTAKSEGTWEFPPPPPAPKSDNRLVLPPPQEAAPPPPVIVQPAPAPVVDDGEARRREEEERRRREAEARELARLRSAMLIVDGSAAGASGGSLTGASGSEAVRVQAPEEDPNRRFLASASAQSVENAKATKIDRIDALVPQGTMIRGVLETAIQSDLAGMVRATTTEDVYSFDGRRILIPKSTMLTGEYRSGLVRGQTRVFVVWTRMLRADGTSVALGSPGADSLGRSGLTGVVDKHYAERFGSAIMLSIVGGVSSFIAGLNVHGDSVTTATGATTTTGQQAQTQAQDTISQTMSDLANQALKDSINIPPTIHVDQGTKIVVFVKRDLDFSDLYADPVREALNELRRARRKEGAYTIPMGGSSAISAGRL